MAPPQSVDAMTAGCGLARSAVTAHRLRPSMRVWDRWGAIGGLTGAAHSGRLLTTVWSGHESTTGDSANY